MGEGDAGYGGSYGGYGDAGPSDTGTGAFSGGFDGPAGDSFAGLGMQGWGDVGSEQFGQNFYDDSGYSWSTPQSSDTLAATHSDEGYGSVSGWNDFDRKLLTPIRSFVQSPIGRVAQAALSIAFPGARGAMGLANLGLGLTGNNPGGAVASTLGGMVGNAMGMPSAPGFGNLGGMLGGMAYNGMSSGQAAPAGVGFGSGQGQGGWGDALGTVGGLAALYQQQRNAGNMASSLGGMFGPNSPYAQQLEQSLSRRDAAAGRRSQYGPRSVELQAKLAGMANQIAPNVMNAQNTQLMRQMQMLHMLGLANQQGAFKGLAGLFGGNGGDSGYSWAQPQDSNTMNSLYGNEGYGDWGGPYGG